MPLNRDHRRRCVLAAVLACAAAVASAGAGSHPAVQAEGARTLEIHATTLTVNAAAQTLEAIGGVRISDGRIVAVAGRAIYYIRERRVLLSSAVAVTAPDGTLRSRVATIFITKTNTIDHLDAQGGVAVRSGTRTLEADRLVYAPATGRLTATGRVKVTAPTGVATGRSLVADLKRNTGTLTAARIQTKEGTLAGDRLDIDGSIREAVIRGSVSGLFGTMRLTSDTATAYEREKKVVFRGRVRITRPGRVLLADVVTFYYQEDRLIAEGQTRILIQESP